jgi:AcrR family transcriptional regulator
MSEAGLRSDRALTDRGRTTRLKLLSAAERTVADMGFDGASIATITARAGVGLGSFYIYFPSKQDILEALVDDFADRVRNHLAGVAAALPRSATRAVIEREALRGFFTFLFANPALHRVLRDAEHITPEAHARYFTRFRRAYVDAFGRLTPHAPPALDVETLAWVMLGIAEVLGMRWVMWERRMPTEDELDSLTDILARGVSR